MAGRAQVVSAIIRFWAKIRQNWAWSLLVVLLTAYAVAKAIHGGNDINVYLYAGGQILEEANIYEGNLYNFYLYSPLFALIMAPLQSFGLDAGRVVWALINMLLTLRLWVLLSALAPLAGILKPTQVKWWRIAVLILSLGFWNHNLILGQVTVLILWLTLEGLFQTINKKRPVLGAALLALGINIKIIPMITLGYLFLKAEFKALFLVMGFFAITLFLPSPIIGHGYNMDLLMHWKEAINPSGDKFALENNDGCQSLNAVLPAFFYEFDDEVEKPAGVPDRTLLDLSYPVVKTILDALRAILLLSVAYLVGFFRCKNRSDPFRFFWEFSYLMLVSMLVFPHQMKYSMLYMVPAASYVLIWLILIFGRRRVSGLTERVLGYVSILILFVLSIMGRDIIGVYAVDVLDYYHFMGLAMVFFIGLLFFIKPEKLSNKFNAFQDS